MKEKEDKAISAVTKEEGRRESFRVDDILPLEYELVSKEVLCEKEKPPLIPEVSLDPKDVTIRDIDQGLLKFLKSIDSKLNLILRHLLKEDYTANILPLKKVNISAGGVRFKCNEKFEIGNILRITISLPGCLCTVLGEVLRVEEEMEGDLLCYNTAVKFLNLSDKLREDIIKYLLDTEREIIKKKRSIAI